MWKNEGICQHVALGPVMTALPPSAQLGQAQAPWGTGGGAHPDPSPEEGWLVSLQASKPGVLFAALVAMVGREEEEERRGVT